MTNGVKVGLVLGGGGVVGLAYHAAALAAIENDLGWDPRTAEVIVGTSAGSMVGAFLRRGLTGTDLAAVTVDAPAPDVPQALIDALRDRVPLPPISLQTMLRPRPPSLSVLRSWMRRPWRFDPVLAGTAILADGQISLNEHIGQHMQTLDGEWPSQDLWVCAVRQRDLRRVVFGRDMMPTGLGEAVAASCSIPGYFSPTVIDGESFLDGGVRSPTNADVLRRANIDAAVVISPMSGQDLPRFHPAASIRRHAKARVVHEVRVLRDHDIPTVLIEPGVDTAAVLGDDLLRDDHLPDVVTAALLDTGDQLRSTDARPLTASLSSRRRRSAV
ncbi:MAG: patatin-like phospholipase family protein [Actinobacteria bacterium]|nr:patatin-like phospholipase family protein [Actinomycetota bacterium]